MIKMIFDSSDCDDFHKNYPNIELSLEGTEFHAAYIANLCRQFMLAMGYQPNTVDAYIPDMGAIEMHLDEVFEEKLDEMFGDEDLDVAYEKVKAVLDSAIKHAEELDTDKTVKFPSGEIVRETGEEDGS